MDTLAEAYFANGNYRRAVDIEKEALELNPNDQELREHLSRYRKAAAF